MLCLYHNESKNMNPNHVENHNRIDIPIKYLYNKFKNKFQISSITNKNISKT